MTLNQPLAFTAAALLLAASSSLADNGALLPTAHHPSIAKIALFTQDPDIVTPTGIAVAPDGRVFVQENHTHKRTKSYGGPAKDRILVFEDTNGDGVSDKRSVFYEGHTFSTDLLFGPDGHLYMSTRWFVARFRDAANRQKAEGEPELLVNCETESDYPHNGVGGLAIDPAKPDWLAFGFGENLGEDYSFVGSDGTRISGGGEGGSTYRCRVDGSELERLSTGHWNAFGMTFDRKGNLFSTDNDPSSTPPNRLLHIVKGADFGYEFRYGRSGRHPLVTWTGEFPGTLGMVAGIGEAACGVIPFGPDQLLIASWADNRVYLHSLQPDGRSFNATRELFISGTNAFRPVHFAYNQNARILYFSDWVKSDYPVHGKGRIWRVELKQAIDLAPSPRQEHPEMTHQEALSHLGDSDAYARTEAVRIIARNPREDWKSIKDPTARSHYAVALRRSGKPLASKNIPDLLNDPSEQVCFVAIKWISDDKIVEHRTQLLEQLGRPDLTRNLMFAILAAQQRLDGAKPSDHPTAKQLLPILEDSEKSATLRALALSLIPEDEINSANLRNWALHESPKIRLEAVRNLRDSGNAEALDLLASLAGDPTQSSRIRAEAIVGLAAYPDQYQKLLESLSQDKARLVSDEAQRALAAGGLSSRSLKPKPTTMNPSDWKVMLDKLPGKANLVTGQRLFFHPRLARCSSCHQMEGRGRRVGPDLTTIHRQAGVDATWLLTHILKPNETIAPQYLPWQVTTKDGSAKLGFVLRKGGTQEVYTGIDGNEFAIPKTQIARSEELPISLMPPGLLAPLQPSEIRDLIAYLLKSSE
ncbi:MAG: HEAT repeat domain-containing protein [Opitutaceae bacterium]|nr:HEAT repeat domain-containing protein [Opitutaceae bacterium]